MTPEPADLDAGGTSPLAFARDYQQYRAAASQTPFTDSRLLLAARFWTLRTDALGDEAFAPFWSEDIPPLLQALAGASLDDLLPEELEEIAAFLAYAARAFPDVAPDPGKVWEKAAEAWLYVGAAERALTALARVKRPGSESDSAHTALPGASDQPPCHPERSEGSAVVPPESAVPLSAEIPEGVDVDALPSLLANRLAISDPALARWLRDFDARWQARRETGDPQRAHCLFVEYDSTGRPVRGRLRTLEGKIEPLKTGSESDELIFHHQVRSPDDPFVGTIYGALAALRQVTSRRREFPRSDPLPSGEVDPAVVGSGEGHVGRASPTILSSGPRFRARFTLSGEGGEGYSGDSVGLAAFAVAYGGWWAGDLHRERRLIGNTVAFTGAVSADGQVEPVAGDSLQLKVRRAFFSPIDNLVVPEANRRDAEAAVEHCGSVILHVVCVSSASNIHAMSSPTATSSVVRRSASARLLRTAQPVCPEELRSRCRC